MVLSWGSGIAGGGDREGTLQGLQPPCSGCTRDGAPAMCVSWRRRPEAVGSAPARWCRGRGRDRVRDRNRGRIRDRNRVPARARSPIRPPPPDMVPLVLQQTDGEHSGLSGGASRRPGLCGTLAVKTTSDRSRVTHGAGGPQKIRTGRSGKEDGDRKNRRPPGAGAPGGRYARCLRYNMLAFPDGRSAVYRLPGGRSSAADHVVHRGPGV